MSNRNFKLINYMGYELIMHIPTKTFNYTRFCKKLKKSKDHNIFRKIVSTDLKIWEIIMTYEQDKTDYLEKNPRNIQTLIDAKICHLINSKVNPHYFGTYGPKYLFLHLILKFTRHEYVKLMNKIMEIGEMCSIESKSENLMEEENIEDSLNNFNQKPTLESEIENTLYKKELMKTGIELPEFF